MSAPVALASLALAFAVSGCDDGSADSGESESGDARACDQDTRGMSFSAGMEVLGDEGKAMIRLADASPAPPIRDLNDWRLELLNSDGSPSADATITVTPWMPDHGHGSPNPDTALIRAAGEGAWDLQDLDLFMAGYWEVHFDIEFADSQTERVTYGFCVN